MSMMSLLKQPARPGEILLKNFLEPNKITQRQFASHLGWTYARLNEIVNCRRGITADSALSFSEAFRNAPEFWLDLQRDWDLWMARKNHTSVLPLV